MNYTFHLTEKCNLNCKYCYEKNKGTLELSFNDIKNIMDIEVKNKSKTCGITFFGGEPLLKKDLIYETINYAKKLEKENNIKFLYSITTNGTLIDDEFIRIAKQNDFLIGYSLDGTKETQNKNRLTHSGEETFNIVSENAKKLVKNIIKLVAMPVITKNNYINMTETTKFLFDLGFNYVNCAFDYTSDWTDEDLEPLKKEYEKLANLYYEKSKNGDNFYLLPFDNKITDYIQEKNCNENCKIAIKHVNIGTNKRIYPCMQFVGIDEYEIGNTTIGIDEEKKNKLREKLVIQEYDVCKECAIKTRCKHTCGCLNLLTTGNPLTTSPLICETERMFIEISDKLAERLYKEKIETFYKKEYCEW